MASYQKQHITIIIDLQVLNYKCIIITTLLPYNLTTKRGKREREGDMKESGMLQVLKTNNLNLTRQRLKNYY